MKTFMRKEYLDLQDVGGLTVHNSNLNQMNLVQELKQHQEVVANDMTAHLTETMVETLKALSLVGEENIDPNINSSHNGILAPPSYGTNTTHAQDPLLQHHMYAAAKQQDPVLMQLMQQMSNMQNQLASLTLSAQPSSTNQSKNDSINQKTGKPWRRYCWTCGSCPHWGRHCPQKKPGHKDEATFRNRMNGSNKNCL